MAPSDSDDYDQSFTRVLPDFTYTNELSQVVWPVVRDDPVPGEPLYAPHSPEPGPAGPAPDTSFDSQANALEYSLHDINILRAIVEYAQRNLNTYDDAHSFGAIFKCYDVVLRQRNIDASRDLFYFKLLLKLIRADGKTWAAKFNNLISALNTRIKQTQREPQLVARYSECVSQQLRRTLRLWQQRAAASRRKHAVLGELAAKYDSTRLASQALEVWQYKLHRVDGPLARLTRLRAARTQAAVLALWYARAADAAAAAALAERALAARFLARWRRRLESVADVAVTHERRAAQHRLARTRELAAAALATWVRRAELVARAREYEQLRRARALERWRQRGRALDGLRARAPLFALQWHAGPVFARWRAAALQKDRLTRVARSFDRRLVLRKTWTAWQDALVRRRRELRFCEYRDRLALARHFDAWVRGAQEAALARAFREQQLKAAAVRQLRLRLRLVYFAEAQRQHTLCNFLYLWVIAERRALIMRVRLKDLKARAFRAWRLKTARALRDDLSAATEVSDRIDVRVVRHALGLWRARLLAVAALAAAADAHLRRRSQAHVLALLQATQRRVVDLDEQARAFARAHALPRALALWRARLARKRDRDRLSLAGDFARRQQRALVAWAFDRWRQRCTNYRDLGDHAFEVYELETAQALRAQHFGLWAAKTADALALRARADDYDRARLVRRTLGHVEAAAAHFQQLHQAALVELSGSVSMQAKEIVRHWRSLALRLIMNNAMADRERAKFRDARVAALLRHWVVRTRQRREGDADDEDSSPDEPAQSSSESDVEVVRIRSYVEDTPTKPRVAFAMSAQPARRAPRGQASLLQTPRAERWDRLKGSPLFEARRRLFATPTERRLKLSEQNSNTKTV
ncbi:Sfi1 spindle body protein-domain-containing protein [Dipodascopsis tothii]|uniref:Sfi1 spindle body protein-domain-containing protein n=1 Tax=Dipodascopsis tothii TaxID=44089 RepID=UPI0034CD6551